MCPFCLEIKDNLNNPTKKNRIIKETNSFIVVPTIGAFIDNYLLIIPKKHINCFKELNSIEFLELNDLTNWIKNINKIYFKSKTIIFEHGSFENNNTSGKSIVHAHLHILPFSKSLLKDIINNKEITINEIKNLSSLKYFTKDKTDYLYYEDINEKRYIINHQELPSQFLRKVVANSLNITTWNWREYPYFDKIDKTLRFYKEIKKENL